MTNNVKMKKIYFLLIIIILVLTGFVFFNKNREKVLVRDQKNEPSPVQVQNNQKEQSAKKYETKKNEDEEVVVEVTPLVLSDSSDTKFSVVLNTHTVDIDKDVKNVSVLIDDKGKEYNPKSWDGGIGGHHLEGTLIFLPLEKGAQSVQLKIKEIGGVERIFEWIL